MKEKDIYIITLKYGYKNLEKGVTHSEVKEYLESKGFKFETKESKNHYNRIFTSVFSEPTGKSWRNHNDPNSEDFICYLNADAYFKLMEYEELKGARKSSLIATIFAIIAIVIAIISTSASIHYSKKQLNTPTVLDEHQINTIKDKDAIEKSIHEIKEIQEQVLFEMKKDTLSSKK